MTQAAQEVWLLALLLWREARGEAFETKRAVACSVRNRVLAPRWWGRDWVSVMTMQWQYSSMTDPKDKNLVKWPKPSDPSWIESMDVASEVHRGPMADTAKGATHYFDKSLDGGHEPDWSKDAGSVHVMDMGNFHFWRAA